ncbi:hypothetical protein [Lactiplantibacillus plantarum]|uniref:hypothetical protein n=1 Tax=Lactiplantibacillus plantarum TaxID=1590 RepID=UPI0007B54C60|nr:hypothetical protein [Lactiplantibacillus plantarum]GEK64231.1 hypothetical protein LJA01_21340 [Lactobacillus japonicus]MBU7470706.1 hypothetical protein [Lactiplantibacillus plantarum]MCB7465282.1 hypothetical protein [Lactiplantibacillus plantarum]MCB7468602.1 hypothetical protein [Lactiplantibacillus plantarum]MCB7472754.1 hypothetical protein [Lactiplantibacillus plantarum]
MEIGTLVAWIALGLTIGQIACSISKSRTNADFDLLCASFVKDKVILKMVVTNHSSNALVINSFGLRYDDPTVFAHYTVNGISYKITKSVSSDVLPLSFAPYQSKPIFLVLCKETMWDHNWALNADSKYKFIIYENGKRKPISKALPITQRVISLEELRKLETDLI